jgi:hypothetical protein
MSCHAARFALIRRRDGELSLHFTLVLCGRYISVNLKNLDTLQHFAHTNDSIADCTATTSYLVDTIDSIVFMLVFF